MTKLTGEAGKNLKVYTGVQADDEVLLSCCPDKRVLLNYHDRKLISNQSGFHLDTKNGVITISPLNFNHSGEYVLEITHQNNSVNEYKYEINVTREYFWLKYFKIPSRHLLIHLKIAIMCLTCIFKKKKYNKSHCTCVNWILDQGWLQN